MKRIQILFLAIFLILINTGAAPWDDAVAVWHMADGKDTAGKSSDLSIHGQAMFGVELDRQEVKESRQRGGDGKAVRIFRDAYLSADQGADGELNVTGQQLSICLRLRVPLGDWDFPIFAKHGGHDKLAFNVYSAQDRLGCEFGTTKLRGLLWATVPFADLLPKGGGRGAWHDVICRIDGAKLELFVDGRCVDEEFMMGEFRQNDEPVLIGAESYGENIKTGFEGLIDHVALWNRALTDEEILFLSGGPGRADRRERTDRGIPGESLQYWRPPNHYFVGDCLPFYDETSGTFHFAYLLDKAHHKAKNGYGAHQWAQATSTDLVNWTHQPLLLPITHQWEGSICTGSVFQHDGMFYAFYATRAVNDIPAPDGKAYSGEFVGVATSSDGIHFTKQQPNPLVVLPRDAGYSGAGRDPVVFRNPADGLFHMYITSNFKGNGCWAHLSSTDLKSWELLPPVLAGGGDPECPDHFEWDGTYYLIVNWGNGFYRMSDSATGPWEKPAAPDILMPGITRVPKTAAYKNGRRIICGWTNEHGFGGHAVFHELIRNPDGTLGEKFVPEMIPKTGAAVFSKRNLSGESRTVENLPGEFRLRATLDFDPAERDNLMEWSVLLHEAENRKDALRLVPAERAVYLGGVKIERVDFTKSPLTVDLIVKDDLADVCVNDCRTATISVPTKTARKITVGGTSTGWRIRSLDVLPLK